MILLSVVAIAAIMGSFVLTAYASDTGQTDNNDFAAWFNGGIGMERGGLLCGHRGGGFGYIEVSDEFKQNVTNIAQNDTDVQGLIADGYTVAGVRPLLKSTVDANGNVVTQATNAVVMMEKDTTNLATVSVDLQQGKVTQIVILTRTVIEKA